MSKITPFLEAQTAFNTRLEIALQSVGASLTGLQEDVQSLNDKIKELQDSEGGVTPEDQATITTLETQGAAMAQKMETLATALEALNALTPPKVPNP